MEKGKVKRVAYVGNVFNLVNRREIHQMKQTDWLWEEVDTRAIFHLLNGIKILDRTCYM